MTKSRVGSGGTPDALQLHKFRSATDESLAVLPKSWICGNPALPDSLIVEFLFLLCHYWDVVRLVRVLPLFGKVDQILAQQPIEQFEILQAALDIAVFPQPILFSADVFLFFVVAKRPRAVLENSFLYVSRMIAHLASILLMLLSFPKFVADPQELDLLP